MTSLKEYKPNYCISYFNIITIHSLIFVDLVTGKSN